MAIYCSVLLALGVTAAHAQILSCTADEALTAVAGVLTCAAVNCAEKYGYAFSFNEVTRMCWVAPTPSAAPSGSNSSSGSAAGGGLICVHGSLECSTFGCACACAAGWSSALSGPYTLVSCNTSGRGGGGAIGGVADAAGACGAGGSAIACFFASQLPYFLAVAAAAVITALAVAYVAHRCCCPKAPFWRYALCCGVFHACASATAAAARACSSSRRRTVHFNVRLRQRSLAATPVPARAHTPTTSAACAVVATINRHEAGGSFDSSTCDCQATDATREIPLSRRTRTHVRDILASAAPPPETERESALKAAISAETSAEAANAAAAREAAATSHHQSDEVVVVEDEPVNPLWRRVRSQHENESVAALLFSPFTQPAPSLPPRKPNSKPATPPPAPTIAWSRWRHEAAQPALQLLPRTVRACDTKLRLGDEAAVSAALRAEAPRAGSAHTLRVSLAELAATEAT